MGARDNQSPGERKRNVFFAENSPESRQWGIAFQSIVASKGLCPILYSGIGRSLIPDNGCFNTLSDQLTDEFFASKTIVLYFGGPNKPGDFDDHWSLHQLKYLDSNDTDIFVYVSKDFPRSVLRRHGFYFEPVVIAGLEEFRAALQRDLISQ
jgi:hypothetical protein